MMKLLLAIFLALSLVNQLKPLCSGAETGEVLANQAHCFNSDFDDDQRPVGTLPVAVLAPLFDSVPAFAARCQDGRPIESLGDRLPLYKLNTAFLI